MHILIANINLIFDSASKKEEKILYEALTDGTDNTDFFYSKNKI